MTFPRCLRRSDLAASPVIGVILMVGTTVILGASVYAWTSTYANVPDHAVKVLALSAEGPLEGTTKGYVVAAPMPGLRYAHVELILDGVTLRQLHEAPCAAPPEGAYVVCRDNRPVGPNATAMPGDRVLVHAQADQTLRVVDSQARFVILTLSVN